MRPLLRGRRRRLGTWKPRDRAKCDTPPIWQGLSLGTWKSRVQSFLGFRLDSPSSGAGLVSRALRPRTATPSGNVRIVLGGRMVLPERGLPSPDDPLTPTLTLTRAPSPARFPKRSFRPSYYRGPYPLHSHAIDPPRLPKRAFRAPFSAGPYIPLTRMPSTPRFPKMTFRYLITGRPYIPSTRTPPTPFPEKAPSRPFTAGKYTTLHSYGIDRPFSEQGLRRHFYLGQHISPTLVRHWPGVF